MLRFVAFSVIILIGMTAGKAETLATTSKSPGKTAAVSRLLAEKQESCRLEAKRRKLTFFKRRVFMHQCRKGKT